MFHDARTLECKIEFVLLANCHRNWLTSKILIFVTESVDERNKEDRQCTHNITLWCVGVTIVAIKHNYPFCALPHFLINGIIFGKYFLNIKMCVLIF